MAAISAVITFYRNSQVLERFRSRISFRDDFESFRNFKRHVESFLGLKEKAIELGVNWFDLKLFRLARSTTGSDSLSGNEAEEDKDVGMYFVPNTLTT